VHEAGNPVVAALQVILDLGGRHNLLHHGRAGRSLGRGPLRPLRLLLRGDGGARVHLVGVDAEPHVGGPTRQRDDLLARQGGPDGRARVDGERPRGVGPRLNELDELHRGRVDRPGKMLPETLVGGEDDHVRVAVDLLRPPGELVVAGQDRLGRVGRNGHDHLGQEQRGQERVGAALAGGGEQGLLHVVRGNEGGVYLAADALGEHRPGRGCGRAVRSVVERAAQVRRLPGGLAGRPGR
jgi:hypothetical protein